MANLPLDVTPAGVAFTMAKARARVSGEGRRMEGAKAFAPGVAGRETMTASITANSLLKVWKEAASLVGAERE